MIKKLIKNTVPIKYHMFLMYSLRKFYGLLDDEMYNVQELLKNKRRFIDVGAHKGYYSYHFLKEFKFVESFEPLVSLTNQLKFVNNKNLTVRELALSKSNGESDFYIPKSGGSIDFGLSSLEVRSEVSEVIKVKTKTLDSFCFDDVDLIKIDVEGHEKDVLSGGIETIKKCQPIMIIEIEQRHLKYSIKKVFKYIYNLGYEGFYLDGKKRKKIQNFDYESDQLPYLDNINNKSYINNFIFIPKS